MPVLKVEHLACNVSDPAGVTARMRSTLGRGSSGATRRRRTSATNWSSAGRRSDTVIHRHQPAILSRSVSPAPSTVARRASR